MGQYLNGGYAADPDDGRDKHQAYCRKTKSRASQTACPGAQASSEILPSWLVAGWQPEILTIFALQPNSKYRYSLPPGPTPTATAPAKTQARPHPSCLPHLGVARSIHLQRGRAPAANLSEPEQPCTSGAGRRPPIATHPSALQPPSEKKGSKREA